VRFPNAKLGFTPQFPRLVPLNADLDWCTSCVPQKGVKVPYARRWRWVQQTTGETTVGGAALKLGVPRANLSRWLKVGMPIGSLVPIIVKFGCDPIEASVVWGHLQDNDVSKLNYEALVRYVPIAVLAAEMSRRASIYSETRPDTERKTTVGMLRRVNVD